MRLRIQFLFNGRDDCERSISQEFQSDVKIICRYPLHQPVWYQFLVLTDHRKYLLPDIRGNLNCDESPNCSYLLKIA